MGVFEQGMAELTEAMQSDAAIAGVVTYHRGNDSVTLSNKVWSGRTPFRVSDQNGSRLIWSEKDFLIPVADLKINGVEVLPEKGDWISVEFDGPEGNQTFQPMHVKDEPFWRYSDPQRTVYRIHTKRRNLS